MARSRRWLGRSVVILALLVIALVMVMRMGRGRFSPPRLVRDKVWQVHTQVSDVYGARIGDDVILFDATADPEGRPIDALLKQLDRPRDAVSDVFITHGHGDHVAAAALFGKARIHAGIGDSDMMSHRGPIVPGLARFMARLMPSAPVKVTDAFLDRALVNVGGDVVMCVPFSGHTPGSMLYLYDGVLFTGDSMVFTGGKLDFAPGVFNVDSAEVRKKIAALGNTIDLARVKVVCTGHGGCTPEADTSKLLADLIQRAQGS